MLSTALFDDAAARCLGSDDPVVAALVLKAGRDPSLAAASIENEIGRTAPTNKRRLAQLYFAHFDALRMSGGDASQPLKNLQSDARAFAPADPIRLAARMTEISGLQSDTEKLRALAAISRDYRSLPDGSKSRTCIALDLAFEYSFLGKTRQAFAFAAEAYRNSRAHPLSVERADAASFLAYLVGAGYDFNYALQLHSEALSIERRLGLSDLAANELLLRGYTKLTDENWRGALDDFEASAAQARSYDNPYAVVYAQVGICAAAIRGNAIARAEPACRSAYERLSKDGEALSFRATALMAKLLVSKGDPAGAIALLNPTIKKGKDEAEPDFWIQALRTRASALAMLNRDAEAYADMLKASEAADTYYVEEIKSGIVAMRARFKTEQLEDNLADEQRRSDARLRLANLAMLAAFTTLSLLAAIVFILLRHRRKFRQLAMTDPLTGLPNRRCTLEKGEDALRGVGAGPSTLAVALMDIDHFKACNDTYGHDAGDRILCTFAEIIRRCIRPGDTVGRWGGEEFLLIAPGAKVEEIARIVERIRIECERQIFGFAPDVQLRFSAGAAQIDETGSRMEECIKLADQRLYLAKAQGRNRTCIVGNEPAPDPEKARMPAFELPRSGALGRQGVGLSGAMA